MEKLKALAAHPMIQLSGWIFALISIALGVLFYALSVERPGLTYAISPARTSVIRAGVGSDLAVTHRGVPITSNVSSIKVAVWNAGKKPVTRAEMLEPFYLDLSGNAPILEARVSKVSRDLSEITVDTSRAAMGRLQLDWRILEKNDGAVIDVIYAGGTDIGLQITGAVVGQGRPVDGAEVQSQSESSLHFNAVRIFTALAMLAVAFSCISVIVLRYRQKKRLLPWRWIVVMAIPYALLPFPFMWRLRLVAPPFGW